MKTVHNYTVRFMEMTNWLNLIRVTEDVTEEDFVANCICYKKVQDGNFEYIEVYFKSTDEVEKDEVVGFARAALDFWRK